MYTLVRLLVNSEDGDVLAVLSNCLAARYAREGTSTCFVYCAVCCKTHWHPLYQPALAVLFELTILGFLKLACVLSSVKCSSYR